MNDLAEDLDPGVFQAYCEMFPPELLSQVYRDFLAQTRQRVAALLHESRPEAIRSVAHTIAGTAGMLGAGQIAQRAGCLERGESLCNPPQLESLMAACASLESQLRDRNVAL